VIGSRYSTETRGGATTCVVDAPVTASTTVAAFGRQAIHLVHSQGGAELHPDDHAFLYRPRRGASIRRLQPGSYQNDAFIRKRSGRRTRRQVDLFDRRMHINTAAFYYDYTDLQIQECRTTRDHPQCRQGQGQGCRVGDDLLATSALRLDANLTWLNAEYFPMGLCRPQISRARAAIGGKKLPPRPDLKVNCGSPV